MIEVVFSENEANTMKLWKSGKEDEVICLGFMLDIGNIREPADSPHRKGIIYSRYVRHSWQTDEEMEEELTNAGGMYTEELERLKAFMKHGDAIRIWYSDAPYSICGFYSLCRTLLGYKKGVSVIKLPPCVIKSYGAAVYQNWSEIMPDDHTEFLGYERKVPDEEIAIYAEMWKTLEDENAPLRAVINGRLMSVPADFYDPMIFSCLKEKPVREDLLIGSIMGQYQISISTWQYARRIDELIAEGRIRVTKDTEEIYKRMICAA